MDGSSQILLPAAASLGFVHTIIGVDHTLPFIMLARAQNWTLLRLLVITLVCGVAHVFSSALLGLIGISIGVSIGRLEFIEAQRGQLGIFTLIGFGLVYTIWALYIESRRCRHLSSDSDLPRRLKQPKIVTAWTLFIIAILGPCEPLIPLLMAPAFNSMWLIVGGILLMFGLSTIVTMCSVVAIGYFGFRIKSGSLLEKYAHSFAGLTITTSGLALKFLPI